MSKFKHTHGRNQQGFGLVEGVMGLLVLTMFLVLSVLLLVNVCLVSYYQGKVGLVADQAAAFAASVASSNYSFDPNLTDSKLSKVTKQVVDLALADMHLPAAKEVLVVQSGERVKVTIAVAKIKLIGNGNILPLTVSLKDSACAMLNNDVPPALVQFSGAGQQAVVPSYGKSDPFPRPRPAGLDGANAIPANGSYKDTQGIRGSW